MFVTPSSGDALYSSSTRTVAPAFVLFKNEQLNEKWQELIKIRNVCNISIEEKRSSKEIGSSLEAELEINIDKKFLKIVQDTDFAELCITSKATIAYKENTEIDVNTVKAKGTKCPVCWKISEESCIRHPE